ncbi:nuclear factor related to kappa-B-binding protein [Ostrinia nubilalis]|uniref:nuclear factor related to kappa-B-binding protein n=1 Tax=Ostrinia nubilalis TaxID=29057 RepID=UPI00308234A0
MDEKMESEQSFSGESSSSSSDTSSGSSDADEEVMEPIRVMGQTLEVPQDLCEDYTIFKELFSMKTWESLEDHHKEELKKYLPKFTENEEEETEKTIKMFFNHEPFHFTSPLTTFYNNLRQGNYRPDIAKMRKFLSKARHKQQKHKEKAYFAKLLPEVLISRERILAAARAGPPGLVPHLPPLPPKPTARSNYKSIHLRAKQRYFEELAAIQGEVGGDESEDENYPEGPPVLHMRKRKQVNVGQNADGNVSGTLGGSETTHATSMDCLKNILASHRIRRQYRENHPELNTAGITLDDIKQRVALVNGSKKLMFGGQKTDSPIQKLKRGPRKESGKGKTQESKAAIKKSKEEPTESVENRPLLPNIKIKCEQEESDSESSSFVDPVTSPKLGKKLLDHSDIKQEIIDPKYPNIQNINYSDAKLEHMIKQEPPDPTLAIQNASRLIQPVPIKLEDLDGIDMMALPVELADDSGEVVPADTSGEGDGVVDADESLTETTHANYLSLVRALFPARAAHRASKQQLHARCAAVMKSPIAPLNTWYSLSDDWCSELDSALDFLSGERGPHPDDFVPYLQFLPETQMYQWIGAGRDCDAILGRLCERWLRAVSPGPPTSEPPPPRYPTSWVMRAPTVAEITEFRAQERRRFAAAAKPFTYLQHGYRSVVGPCVRASAACGTQGSLLAAERPRHASFIALVRDAVARLPNGEGTRHDVLTLLKPEPAPAPPPPRPPPPRPPQQPREQPHSAPHPAPQPAMELEVGSVEEVVENASDSDVDVDDTSAPAAPHVSSAAQLLMAATQAAPPKPPPAPKPKGKLVATPKPKPSPQPKPTTSKPNLMTQSAKQATLLSQAAKHTLMSQAVKQANLLSQSVKQSQIAKQAAQKSAPPLQTIKTNVTPKQTTVAAQKAPPAPTPKQTPPRQTSVIQTKHVSVTKQPAQSPKSTVIQTKQTVVPQAKPAQPKSAPVQLSQATAQAVAQISKSLPSVVTPPHKSPLIKQRPMQRVEAPQATVSAPATPSHAPTPPIQQVPTVSTIQTHNKLVQGTRSLLIRPPAVPTTATAAATPTTQAVPTSRRGVVRVLSPATQSSGKSLISPRALLQQGATTVPAAIAAKKRTPVASTTSVTTMAQAAAGTSVVSSAPTVATSAVSTRTVQLAGGRTVQLAANQTVHLPGGQAVQLSGHTLQLSSLQLPTHSVRLPSGQTVQLASPTMQAVRAVSTTAVKNPSPRATPSSPTIKTVQTSQAVPIPVSTVQLSGQTVQIAGQTVQLAGQSVQLTGHTVKLPSGQSVQVASQSVIPSQSVQLPSGQTVQLASGNVQTVQLGSNIQLPSGQSVQMPSGQSVQLGSQTVQIAGQTVQLAGGQTVQLPSGQTLQLSSGQTVQLSSGQTLQLASGQTVQLANQPAPKITQVVRSQSTGDKPAQPIVAKLLTNAQGQMISLEGVVGARGVPQLQLAGGRGRAAVRVLSPARPLLLTAAKPLHNIILQQGDGNAIRVTSSSGATPSQTIVLSNLGAQAVTTSSTTTPVLKLQQVNPLQQVKLAQGIKIQQATSAASSSTAATSSGVRSVLMDGQQLKLVGGRHVLARILRPAHPPP